jgi:CBS-domain-containing membrane protein
VLVSDVMRVPTHLVREHTQLPEALSVITTAGTGSVPVVDARGALVGLVSEVDVLRVVVRSPGSPTTSPTVSRTASDHCVADVMTRHPSTVAADLALDELAQLFVRVPWRTLPVVRHERLVGVVTRADVAQALFADARVEHKAEPP